MSRDLFCVATRKQQRYRTPLASGGKAPRGEGGEGEAVEEAHAPRENNRIEQLTEETMNAAIGSTILSSRES